MRVFHRNQDSSTATEYSQIHPKTEWEFESFLNENPSILLDEDLLLIGRQTRLDSGILDLLALDEFGNTIVIEIKQGESGSGSASEETILSQPQNYAQSLSTHGYDELDKIYRQYRTGDWNTSPSIENAETLEDAFETAFGVALAPGEYNDSQRMVILAETITRRTAMNARYLLEEGLNVQCVEVQQFETAEGTSTTVTNTVVDYSIERVRPDREGAPRYPEVARTVAERTFENLQDIGNADAYYEVFDGFDGYEPGFQSDVPSHPDSVRYNIHLRPLLWESVGIGLQVRGGDTETLKTIREHAGEFEERGFNVSLKNKRDRIVKQFWNVDSPSAMSEDEFIDTLADRLATLIQTGHDVFENELLSDRSE